MLTASVTHEVFAVLPVGILLTRHLFAVKLTLEPDVCRYLIS